MSWVHENTQQQTVWTWLVIKSIGSIGSWVDGSCAATTDPVAAQEQGWQWGHSGCLLQLLPGAQLGLWLRMASAWVCPCNSERLECRTVQVPQSAALLRSLDFIHSVLWLLSSSPTHLEPFRVQTYALPSWGKIACNLSKCNNIARNFTGIYLSPARLSFYFPAVSEMTFGILACKAILELFC